MQVLEEIESKKPGLQDLCRRIGIPALRVRINTDRWSDVTFIGDIDETRLDGYADRFFTLEEGLVRLFHRRVHLLDLQMDEGMQARHAREATRQTQPIELLHAS